MRAAMWHALRGAGHGYPANYDVAMLPGRIIGLPLPKYRGWRKRSNIHNLSRASFLCKIDDIVMDHDARHLPPHPAVEAIDRAIGLRV